MTIAATRSGKVEGVEHDGVLVFRGIPYAAPPRRRAALAARRCARTRGTACATRPQFSPQSAQADVRRCTRCSASAQPRDRARTASTSTCGRPRATTRARPVMVWIHGGAFVFGSGRYAVVRRDAASRSTATSSSSRSTTGSARSASCTSPTLFGAEFAGSGNAGILDQVAALEWVRDSIAAFGGDPDERHDLRRVGRRRQRRHAARHAGRARAVPTRRSPQSGAGVVGGRRASARPTIAQRVHRQAGRQAPATSTRCGRCRSDTLIAGRDRVSAAVGGVARPSRSSPSSTAPSLPQPPLDAVAAGNADGVHLLDGTNQHEMTLFHVLDPDARRARRRRRSRLASRPWYGADAELVVATYRRRAPDATTAELWSTSRPTRVFRIPAIRLAEAQLAHGPVWMYLFTWETPVFGGVLRVDATRSRSRSCSTPRPARRRAVHRRRARAPGDRRRDAPGVDRVRADRRPERAGLPEWPAYDTERRATMRFDAEPGDPRRPDGRRPQRMGEFRR